MLWKGKGDVAWGCYIPMLPNHTSPMLSEPTFALKSPRMMNLSLSWTAVMTAFKSSKTCLWSQLGWSQWEICTDDGSKFCPLESKNIIVFRRSFTPFGKPTNLPTGVSLLQKSLVALQVHIQSKWEYGPHISCQGQQHQCSNRQVHPQWVLCVSVACLSRPC